MLPEPFRLENDSMVIGWARVGNEIDVHELETKLASAGWTFFYMAGAIWARAFGFRRRSAILAALRRLLTAVKRQRCNCLEIEDVETRSFWGIPYVSVSGHARHIQKGVVFCASEVAPLDGIPSRDVDRVIHQRIPGWGQQA
jgi:hypothetical protein